MLFACSFCPIILKPVIPGGQEGLGLPDAFTHALFLVLVPFWKLLRSEYSSGADP